MKFLSLGNPNDDDFGTEETQRQIAEKTKKHGEEEWITMIH